MRVEKVQGDSAGPLLRAPQVALPKVYEYIKKIAARDCGCGVAVSSAGRDSHLAGVIAVPVPGN